MSPRTAAQNRGIQRERDLRKLLEADGWFVVRAAGSHGNADLLAMRAGERSRLIEVKSTATPFSGFRPPERRALIQAARIAGADAYVCWWPKNGKPQWFPVADWPRLRILNADLPRGGR